MNVSRGRRSKTSTSASLLTVLPLVMAAMALLNHRYYRFLYSKRGIWFVVRAYALRLLHDLGNGLSFAVDTTLFVVAHHLGRHLPGALAVDSWTARFSRQAAAEHA